MHSLLFKLLYYAWSPHCISHFHKSGYISTFHLIEEVVIVCTVFHTLFVNVVHNLMQSFINFFCTPAKPDSILTHFQSRCSHTARIHSFTWCIQGFCSEECINSFG